jgi:hypothetical protein
VIHKRIYLYLAVLFALLAAGARVLYLDRDLPHVGLTTYYAEDEMFYTSGAFNLLRHGDIDYKHTDYIKPDTTGLSSPAISWFGYASLKLLGNNYYGLRAPALIANLISAMLLLYLVNFWLRRAAELPRQNNSLLSLTPTVQKTLMALSLLYVGVDFSFLMSSRALEPTIIRMMFMCIIFTLTLLADRYKPHSHVLVPFLLGTLASMAFIFVYLSNAFLPAAIVFYFFISGFKTNVKTAFIRGFASGCGTLFALGLFYLYYRWQFPNPLGQEAGSFYGVFGSRVSASSPHFNMFVGTLINLLSTFTTNMFRTNQAVQWLFLSLLPIFIYGCIYRKRNHELLLFSVWLLFSLQSLFINDFPTRKMLMLFPLMVLIVISGLSYLHDFRQALNNKHRKMAYLLYLTIVALLILASIAGNALVSMTPTFDTKLSLPFSALMLGSATIMALGFLMHFYRQIALGKTFVALFIITCIPASLYLNAKEIYLEPTFHRRDAMISMAETLKGKNVVSGESIGMRLYTDAHFFLNPFRYLTTDTDVDKLHEGEYGQVIKQLMAEGKIDYAYARLSETRFDMQAMGFEIIKTFDVNVEEGRKKIALYRPIPDKQPIRP